MNGRSIDGDDRLAVLGLSSPHPRPLPAQDILLTFRRNLSWRVPGIRLYAVALLAVVAYMAVQLRVLVNNAPVAVPRRSSVAGFGLAAKASFSTPGPVAGGRVVVTGGAGTIGKELIRKLLESSTPVTLFDVRPFPYELQEIQDEFPVASSQLKITQGDVRDLKAVHSAMTNDVVGVVHLAAIAREIWCKDHEVVCFDIAERGTQTVLSALSDLNQRDKGHRWFILASSADAYHNAANPMDGGSSSVGALAASKLKAENIVHRHLDHLETQKAPGALHAATLRMSTVYGSILDHVDRMIPSVVTSALNHHVIQVANGQQKFDMLHIDDAVAGVMLTIQNLTKRSKTWSLSLSKPRTTLDIFDLVSDSIATADELVDKVVRLTRSKSPLRFIPTQLPFPNYIQRHSKNVLTELGSKRPISVDEGLLRLVRGYLEATERQLKSELNSSCGKASPSLRHNEAIEKLDGCTASFVVDLAGELASIVISKDRQQWVTSLEVPLPETVRTSIRIRDDGKPILSLRGASSSLWFGLATTNFTEEGPVFLAAVTDWEKKNGGLVDWEMDVNKEDSAVRLILAGTPYQLIGPPSPEGYFALVSKDLDLYPFRINPICCPNVRGPWPFSADDPNDFMLEYQKTSVKRPFLGSPAKALCSRLKRAREKALADLATLSLDRLEEPRWRLSSRPTEWTQADLPPCSNLCNLPTVCLNTGNCQCTYAICPSRDRFPFSDTASLEFREPASFAPKTGSTRLTHLMDQVSWKDVLRPQGRQFVELGSPAKVHMGPLIPSEEPYRATAGIDRIPESGYCYSADTSMEAAVKLMNVTEEEADMTFVIFYQQREFTKQLFEQYEWTRSQVRNFDPTKVVIPFTHDWGQCFEFEWEVWAIRAREGFKVNPYVRSTTAWSVMSDKNSRCYRSHQDVVIPPRTCVSAKLFAAFGDISRVRPIRERRVFSFFKGGLHGSGKTTRLKILCRRPPIKELYRLPDMRFKTDQDFITLYGTRGPYKSYMDIIGDSIFCPQPAGTTGWATRIVDVMYAGCIPVFIGQMTEYPFFDLIDWGKISVQIDQGDVNRLEEVLMERYTMEAVERLQANMMLIRDALVYPLDDITDETRMDWMWKRRGPLWFALYSTGMRLATQWPIEDGWVTA